MLPVFVPVQPFAYAFPPLKTATYAVSIKLDGFLPIFGGSEGKAQADVVIGLKGLAPNADGPNRLSYELKDINVMFNDAAFPMVTVDSAKQYFPKTTISYDPLGRVLKNDAPDVKVPIKLPGLDVKRFPEITFLGVELPPDGITEGKAWSYRKPFGDADVDVEAKAVSVADDKVEVEFVLKQAFDNLEDAGKAVPANPKDAVASVHTEMKGTGKATLDPTGGLLKVSHMDAESTSTVTDLATKAVSTRKLHTSVDVKLGDTAGGAIFTADAKPASKTDQLKALLKIYWQVAMAKATPYMEAFKANLFAQITRLQDQIVRGF